METTQQTMQACSAHAAGAQPSCPECHKLTANPPEIGGRDGLDPTRYGDWEIKGRAVDF